MKIMIKDYCIRCGLCEDLYPALFKLNTEDDRIDILVDEVPAELVESVKNAAQDCAIAAIGLK